MVDGVISVLYTVTLELQDGSATKDEEEDLDTLGVFPQNVLMRLAEFIL